MVSSPSQSKSFQHLVFQNSIFETKIFKFLNQCFAWLWHWKKCLKFTKPTCWINSCFSGDTFLRPKSCKTLYNGHVSWARLHLKISNYNAIASEASLNSWLFLFKIQSWNLVESYKFYFSYIHLFLLHFKAPLFRTNCHFQTSESSFDKYSIRWGPGFSEK